MTSITSEYVNITSMADVEAIDPETDNRMAIRSLRHAADRLAKESDSLKRRAESDGSASLNIRCSGTDAASWRERLVEAKAALTADPETLKAQLLDQAQAKRELAVACLSKAIDILDAHPNGLPSESVESSGVEAQDLEDDEDDDEDEEG
jgi:hypothetical protein